MATPEAMQYPLDIALAEIKEQRNNSQSMRKTT
jgi:hypothetical protein